MLQQQMKSLKDRVTNMLMRFPQYRDDDYKLMAHIWMDEMGGRQECFERCTMDFLQTYAHGNLSHSESIRRIRQKIQEQRPDLRGSRWQERESLQQLMQTDVNGL